MADRFPLILNTSANQIQEIASGDTLDLTDVNISNAGVITATSFAGDGSGLIGVASTDNIVTGTAATFNTFPIDINAGMDVAGVSTFAGNIDANGDLDVDGHTDLDNVTIAGVTTANGTINISNGDLRITSTDAGSSAAPIIRLIRESASPADNDTLGQINFTGENDASEPVNYAKIRGKILDASDGTEDGIIEFTHIKAGTEVITSRLRSDSLQLLNDTNLSVSGDTTLTGDLDVDGHTNLDNVSVAGVVTATSFVSSTASFTGSVSIGGTLTYEDVTNIDSVGIITARSDVKVGTGVTLTPAGAGFFSGIVTASSFKTPSGQALIHDQTATFGLIFPADDKLRIYQNGTHKFAFEFPTVSGFLRSRLYFNHSSDDNTYIDNVAADTIGITVGGTERLNINPTGINVTGVCTATSFVGDGSNLTGVGISTEQVTPSSNVATLDLSKDDHKIVASGTYTIDVSGGTEAENHVIRIENSGISTVGFSTYFKFPSGGTPALPTASGAISLISFTVHKVGSVGIATVLLAGASVNFS